MTTTTPAGGFLRATFARLARMTEPASGGTINTARRGIFYASIIAAGLIGSLSFAQFADAASLIIDEPQRITSPAPELNAKFGTSVSVSGDRAIVGTELDAAYFFVRNNSDWVQDGLERTGMSGSGFGISVAISGDTAIVGTESHVAYISERDASGWPQQGLELIGATN